MKINYNVQGKERKSLVNIIAETINAEAEYLKAPTYAFEIGAFTVTREGAVECDVETAHEDEINAVIAALEEAGFEGENCEDEGDISPDNAEIEDEAEDFPQAEIEGENGVDSGEDEGILTISYPLSGFNPDTLANLAKIVESKASLIKNALGVEELPIRHIDNELQFPWFNTESAEEIHAYSQFIERLCKTAIAKKRVTATAPEAFDNEKFSMRVWLISLGCKGEEFAFLRKRLMRDLSGNSGFRYEDKQPRNPRGERVQKEVLSIRLAPEVLGKVETLASQSGMTRNAFIESIVGEYAERETAPTADGEEANSDE